MNIGVHFLKQHKYKLNSLSSFTNVKSYINGAVTCIQFTKLRYLKAT